jgi:hypothetical protein
VIAPVIKGLELGRRLGLARAGCIVGIAVTAVRRIGENELRDVQSGGSCAQRERRTGGVTVDQCRLAGLGDERGHIVEFTFDRARDQRQQRHAPGRRPRDPAVRPPGHRRPPRTSSPVMAGMYVPGDSLLGHQNR